MTTEQVNPHGHEWRRNTDQQFARLEVKMCEKLDRVLEGQIRIEERSAALATKVFAHNERLDSHSREIRNLQISTAVAGEGSMTLNRRWGAVGAVMLVAAGAFIGNVVERIFL